MYKMLTFSIKTWSKITGAEAIKHNHKKWINEKYLETALGHKNLVSNKTQTLVFVMILVKYKLFDEFKKTEIKST